MRQQPLGGRPTDAALHRPLETRPTRALSRCRRPRCQIAEDDARRIADSGVGAGEIDAPRPPIPAKHWDVVGSLIAAIEEPARRVEVEAAGVVPTRPFFPDECQGAAPAYGKDPDAVVQPVASIDKPAIG